MRRVVKKKNTTRLNWTAWQLNDNYQLGKATYDNAVQRGLVWKNDKKSLFIHTLMQDGLVPPLYVATWDNETYDFIDGKQRSFALFEFMNDGYALENVPEVEVIQEDGTTVELEDVNGKKYSELPDYMQDAIRGFLFDIHVLINPTEEEVSDTFYRLNNGTSLNAMTLSRVKAKDRNKISTIGKNKLFKKALTPKALSNYDNEMLVVKSYMMIQNGGDTGLEMKDVRQCMEQMEITQEESLTLTNVFDRILSVHDRIEDRRTAKRIIAKTHLVSITPFIKKSIDEGRDEDDIVQWLSDFYNNGRYTTKSESYNSTVRCGTSKKESVKKRYFALEESYNECMQHIDARRNFHVVGKMSA